MQTVQLVALMNNFMAAGLNYGFFYEFDAIGIYVYVLCTLICQKICGQIIN